MDSCDGPLFCFCRSSMLFQDLGVQPAICSPMRAVRPGESLIALVHSRQNYCGCVCMCACMCTDWKSPVQLVVQNVAGPKLNSQTKTPAWTKSVQATSKWCQASPLMHLCYLKVMWVHWGCACTTSRWHWVLPLKPPHYSEVAQAYWGHVHITSRCTLGSACHYPEVAWVYGGGGVRWTPEPTEAW